MKQVLQDLVQGTSTLYEGPAPLVAPNKLLIASRVSLISSGTERMLVDFGKASYLNKARQQPEKVKMVLEKIKTDGLLTTLDAVRSKLANPLPLGYCNVGVILKKGADVAEFSEGMRVVSNGPHADIVHVGKNLCAQIPDTVDDESAAFTVLASIGLQGIRLAAPTLGEKFVVIGVGLIGLLTIQLLRAQGCSVLAIDFDERKLQLAKTFGAQICNLAQGEDPVAKGMVFTNQQGVDGVIITASTSSNDPVCQAAQMSRKRGRIVLVGVSGLELNRSDFYEKELTFQVSCSYGPGRYDANYEEKGIDYPLGFVRWTEQRNFEAILHLMACGLLNVKPLISHRYLFEEAEKAYDTLSNDTSVLGILLHYVEEDTPKLVTSIALNPTSFHANRPVLGAIGAGNYAARVLLPAFKAAKAQCHTLVTASGISSAVQGKYLGFSYASSDVETLLTSNEINTIIIATRHDTHASLVEKALLAGKHVFVEKPLAIDLEGLATVEKAYHEASVSGTGVHLMVGFNRRFAPHIQKIKDLLKTVSDPKSFIITVNAGAIPLTHWTQDSAIGGGRIIGEACHFVDLLRFLADAPIQSVQVKKLGTKQDAAVIVLGFADGSCGTIHYLSNGSAQFPKERVEIFTGGRILQLDNFRTLVGFGWPKFKKMSFWKQNKGQDVCCKAFLEAIEEGKKSPIPFDELIEVARTTIEIARLLNQ